MTILSKLLFRKKPEPKAPDAFEEIRAQAPPYLVDKDYIYDSLNASVFEILDMIIVNYKSARGMK